MIGRLWNFVKRHKKKFIFVGVLIVGGRYGYTYFRQRMQDFQQKEAAECLEHARRQHHFESNQRTCNMTVLSMLPTLREKLIVLLNTEKITEMLKSNPSNKVELWEDLKILSLTRVVSVVYSCTMMCMLLRVQLNIIGGYMYADNVNHHKGLSANVPMSVKPTEAHERYLGLIREFFEKGLENLVLAVKEAVIKETKSMSLKEKVSLENLESIVRHVRERVETGHEINHTHPPTMPLSEYLVCWNTHTQSAAIEDASYNQLLQETHDILQSEDFHCVFSSGLDRGFAKLQDYLAEYYKPLQKTESSILYLHEVAVPVAKLIPFLSSLIYKLGSDAPNPLVQELLLLEQTKILAANIYEAFSQTEEQEDVQFSP